MRTEYYVVLPPYILKSKNYTVWKYWYSVFHTVQTLQHTEYVFRVRFYLLISATAAAKVIRFHLEPSIEDWVRSQPVHWIAA